MLDPTIIVAGIAAFAATVGNVMTWHRTNGSGPLAAALGRHEERLVRIEERIVRVEERLAE